MLSEENSEVCKQAIVRALPCLEGARFHVEDKARFVERWLSAAASLKYTQEIGQAVVEVLLRMVCSYEWRRHVTPAAWNWLKRRPQLPPVSWARQGCCSNPSTISEIQALNNPELLTAYLIVVCISEPRDCFFCFFCAFYILIPSALLFSLWTLFAFCFFTYYT